jgi:hypothetical protein
MVESHELDAVPGRIACEASVPPGDVSRLLYMTSRGAKARHEGFELIDHEAVMSALRRVVLVHRDMKLLVSGREPRPGSPSADGLVQALETKHVRVPLDDLCLQFLGNGDVHMIESDDPVPFLH